MSERIEYVTSFRMSREEEENYKGMMNIFDEALAAIRALVEENAELRRITQRFADSTQHDIRNNTCNAECVYNTIERPSYQQVGNALLAEWMEHRNNNVSGLARINRIITQGENHIIAMNRYFSRDNDER